MFSKNKQTKEFLNKKNIIAVIGVSSNSKKYGNKVFFDLLNSGYKVYAINKKGGKIKGHKCYKSLKALPKKPDIVNIVVPPNTTKSIVKECNNLGINKVWMQPGSESQETINYCNKNKIKVLHNMCIMIEK
jgi:hypothetical protein